MSDNWVVQNLQKSLSTWNDKFAEVWELLTQSPEDFKGELDETSVGFSDKSTGGRKSKIYNLDMILSVGYRVNSKRCIAFRKWANNVLKQFILKGYAINEKRLEALEKTVDIQSRMLADALDIEESDVLRAVNEYTNALLLLDQYDHQVLCKPEGNKPIYRITYEECVRMVGKMKDSFDTDVFGVEKEPGKVEGIIDSVYQSAFGQDAYPSVEEKAANPFFWSSWIKIMLYSRVMVNALVTVHWLPLH